MELTAHSPRPAVKRRKRITTPNPICMRVLILKLFIFIPVLLLIVVLIDCATNILDADADLIVV
jgi:hypothetical protein